MRFAVSAFNGLIVGTLLLMGGCAMVFPRTAEVLEPRTFEDLALAFGADVERLIQDFLWLIGVL